MSPYVFDKETFAFVSVLVFASSASTCRASINPKHPRTRSYRKYSMVLVRPSSSCTFGSHWSSFFAKLMSGLRCFGSSWREREHRTGVHVVHDQSIRFVIQSSDQIASVPRRREYREGSMSPSMPRDLANTKGLTSRPIHSTKRAVETDMIPLVYVPHRMVEHHHSRCNGSNGKVDYLNSVSRT